MNKFPILHALLRGLNYCLKLVYKLSAGVDEWKENSQTKAKVRVAKKFIQETIKAKTGLTVDKLAPVGVGGTTTTGNMARQLLSDSVKRKFLVDCVLVKIRADEKCDQKMFDEFITNYSVILRAISSRRNINADCLNSYARKHL